MISKEFVEKTIQRNDQSAAETKQQRKETGDMQYSESRRALCEDIAELPDEELLDLLALMEYGRELKQNNLSPSEKTYRKHREQVMNDYSTLTPEIKKQKAMYLLGKRDLSAWLTLTLPIYDTNNFEF